MIVYRVSTLPGENGSQSRVQESVEFASQEGQEMNRLHVIAVCSILMLPGAALHADTVFVPPGLSGGDMYQLVFVTNGTRDGLSDDITDCNAFVNAEAALNSSKTGSDIGVDWFAIASTPTIHARDNALVSVPVY